VIHDGRPRWVAGLLGLAFRVAALGLVTQALWIVWRGRPADLVESRARLRVVIVAAFGICSALVLLAALLYAPSAQRPPAVQAGEALVFLLVGATAGVLVLHVDPDLLPPAEQVNEETRHARQAPAPDRALARLEFLMKEQEVWREPGLTVAALATRVNIPEYRLRRLINQQLGFRNFTAFLNEYRLAAAADRLADRQHARTPILTIALDLGWGSIGPFNRAFRARFGVPPSDYRRARL
jgi:AraC-like DNA-binding protein